MVLGVVFGLVMANIGKPDQEVLDKAAGYNTALTSSLSRQADLEEDLEALRIRFKEGQTGGMAYLVQKKI